MKSYLRRIFSPILKHFENGSEAYRPASWKRPALLFICLILIALAIAVPLVAPEDVRLGALAPTIVFGAIGFTGLIVAVLGSDHAVAKILGGL